TLTATGAPQASQFGDLPALNWHTYGSGHLHGMSAPGLDLEIALEPDALHRETQRRLSTSANDHNQPLMLERGYTNLGQLDHLTLRSPDTTSQQSYQYDALGRMSFRSLEGDPASKVIAYSYDAAGRLIGSQHGDHAHRYSVDAAGNRLEGQQALSDNRLGQLNGTRYRYDGAGNLIERQQPNGERLTLGYDGANRLVHLTHASELGYTRDATYRYDGLGRRISKTVRHTNGTTATTHYGWDGDRIVREETDNQRTTVVYEPGSFVPMLRIDDTQQGQVLSAYITDALGTPMQLVTPNGQPRWLAEPDDWAAVKNQRAVRNVIQPIRFQGQWHDEESGLYYNRHRYYDPQQGRYISQDPIGLKGGTNLYGYVTNPTGMVDPLGLEGAHPWNHAANRVPSPPPMVTACPASPPVKNEDWIAYYGDPRVFHCGYKTFHEDITPTDDRLMGECVYDDFDQLVDEIHEFAGCRGTANRWGSDDTLKHIFWDEGGIAHIGRLESAGLAGLTDSVRHGSARELIVETMGDTRQALLEKLQHVNQKLGQLLD
ncbi:hypothetical protein J7J49_15060, partial [Halomonas sp. ISL-56]|uniref:RHS repeat-associated core domain-containing protein n=1 Tax=Halomonas sp. ISL-56 TaxID=2819149 RepID=UPI001C1A3FB5